MSYSYSVCVCVCVCVCNYAMQLSNQDPICKWKVSLHMFYFILCWLDSSLYFWQTVFLIEGMRILAGRTYRLTEYVSPLWLGK